MKIRKLAIALLAVSTSLSAFAQSPLLQDGKEAMYQRVLTTPSCVLKKDRQDPGVKVASLSRFYVYNQDGDYLTVGPDTTGKIAGLLPKSCTVDWKIQTSVLFTNPANRNRALIFQDKSRPLSIPAPHRIKSCLKGRCRTLRQSLHIPYCIQQNRFYVPSGPLLQKEPPECLPHMLPEIPLTCARPVRSDSHFASS